MSIVYRLAPEMARDAASFALVFFQQRRQPRNDLRLPQPEIVLLAGIALKVVKLTGGFTKLSIGTVDTRIIGVFNRVLDAVPS